MSRVVASLFFTCALLGSAVHAAPLADQVQSMRGSARSKFLGMLVRQSGAECKQVQRAFFQGQADKAALWNVRCTGGKGGDFGVVLLDDTANTVRVMPCAQLKEFGASACFRKL